MVWDIKCVRTFTWWSHLVIVRCILPNSLFVEKSFDVQSRLESIIGREEKEKWGKKVKSIMRFCIYIAP